MAFHLTFVKMDAAQNKVNNNIREREEAKEEKKGVNWKREKKKNKSVGEGMMDQGLDTDYNTEEKKKD